MPTLKERYVDNKNSLQLLQLLVNNQSTLGKSTITSSNKHPWNQPPLSYANKAMNLVRIACALETS
jgi:hypothetical protein